MKEVSRQCCSRCMCKGLLAEEGLMRASVTCGNVARAMKSSGSVVKAEEGQMGGSQQIKGM